MKDFFKKHIYKLVIILLALIFVCGFTWGLKQVLKMEGIEAPVKEVVALVPAPQNMQESVDYLDALLESAIELKPSLDYSDRYGIDSSSIEVTGNQAVKDSIKLILNGTDSLIGDDVDADFLAAFFTEKDASCGFNENIESILSIPKLKADDLTDFDCLSLYYTCDSCGKTVSGEYPECEFCGSNSEYVLHDKDYVISFSVKNQSDSYKSNFTDRTHEEIEAFLGEKLDKFVTNKNVNTSEKNASFTFRVNKETNQITSLTLKKVTAVEASADFTGEYAALGNTDVSFDVTETLSYSFTWPSLVLSAEELVVEPKSSDNLLATLTCTDPLAMTVKWSSSDENILTIDEDGYFNTHKETGEAIVTAEFEFNGRTYSDTCVVKVRVPVESIDLNKGSLKLGVGDTYQLKIKFSPKHATVQTAKWYSDNENVAVVDENGLVTAVGSGVAVIKTVSDDGYMVSTCEVKVN